MTNAKRERTIDMTQGKFLPLVLRFSIPLLIGSIFQQIYSVVDTVVAGYVLGDRAIAAIGSTGSLYGLIIQLSGGLAGGFVLVITRCFGAKEPGRLRRAVASTFVLSGGITLIMTVISLLFLRQFMVLMDTPESILEEAYSYMFVICAGLLATVGYNMFSGIMRAFGNSFTPLCVLIFSSLLNIGLDLLFVAVLHMGVAGAALATVLAQLMSMLVCAAYFLRNYKEYLPRREDFKPDWPLIREMLSTGCAMAFMYSIVCIGGLFFQRAVNALGDVIIAAHTSASRLFVIIMSAFGTLTEGASTFIGQNWGTHRADRVRDALKKSMLLEICLGLIACLLIFLLDEPALRLMTGTQNPKMLYWGTYNLRVMAPFLPVVSILFILRTSMQAIGQKLAPVISSVLELLMRFVGAVWMVLAFGYAGAAWNTPLTWSVMTGFIFVVYLVKTRGMLRGNGSKKGFWIF